MAEYARRRARDNVPADAFVHFDTPLTLAHEMQCLREAGFGSVELVGFLEGDGHTAMLQGAQIGSWAYKSAPEYHTAFRALVSNVWEIT